MGLGRPGAHGAHARRWGVWCALQCCAWALVVAMARARPSPDSLSEAGAKGGGSQIPRRELQSSSLGSGFWSVQGTDFIDANGQPVRFSGVTWQGFETPWRVFTGLDKQSYTWHFDKIKELGFNALRLPFSGDILQPAAYPQWGACGNNQDLWSMTSLQVLDKMIYEAGQRGIKVILDYHRIHQSWDNEWGVWWDASAPESTWLDNWKALATRYQGNPTILGADLFNEIHHNDAGDIFPGSFPDGAPYWTTNAGDNEAYNFRRATLAAINAIHSIEPNWIIFMEGMWNGPYWWGGNVSKLLEAPILEPAGKLAYSAHDYGPYVAPLPWFFDSTFPNNLVPLYRKNWGLVVENGIGPLWIGEFGSFLPPNTTDLNYRERTTFLTQVGYIKQLKASWTIAFWGPDSKDTGGILNDDWQTVNTEKLGVLAPIMYPNFNPNPTG